LAQTARQRTASSEAGMLKLDTSSFSSVGIHDEHVNTPLCCSDNCRITVQATTPYDTKILTTAALTTNSAVNSYKGNRLVNYLSTAPASGNNNRSDDKGT